MGCLWFIPARRFPGLRVADVLHPSRLAAEGALSLESAGLGHLSGAALTFRGCLGAGPDGGAGLVVGLSTPANETGYWPDRQEWRPAAGGDVYVGWPAGARPGPQAFLRADALAPEASVVMADGQVWELVPTSSLPEVMGYGSDGEVAYRPRARDAAHFSASAWLYQYARGGETAPYLEVLERVAVCFGARYHVSLMEVLALELFSTELLEPVIFACLGIVEKKTAAD